MLCFGIDEGLHAEAYPVDAALDHGCEGRVVELAGGALDGDLSVGQSDEFPAYREEEALDEMGREQRRGSAAEVNGVGDFGKHSTPTFGLVAD